MKAQRVHRTKADIGKELCDQVALMMAACQTFDNGLRAAGKHIALSLRVLLHHQGQSKALLEQLGIRTERFFDTGGPINPRNILTTCNLVGISTESADYQPLFTLDMPVNKPRKLPFAE